MKKSFLKIISITLVLLLLLPYMVSCSFDTIKEKFSSLTSDISTSESTGEKQTEEETKYEVPEGSAQFHFIDIGQGDASLIIVGGKNILIDTGDKGGKTNLISYLAKYDVKEIEYFVVTHPDADHFASAAYVIDNYTVKNLIMSEFVKTTKMYEEFISTIEKHEEINVISANENVGKSYYVSDLELKILAPLKHYSDPNEESVVLIARFGNTKVMYTGDAEAITEKDMLAAYSSSTFKSDLLKVGHHGSSTSSTQEFLNAVSPTYAVISCGTDNKYGHPHTETMDKLNGMNIEIHRTDLEGSIVFESNGETISHKGEAN